MKLCLAIPTTGNTSVQIRGDRANQGFALGNSPELTEFSWNDLNLDAVCICINPVTARSVQSIVEGSKFRESHILKILSWRVKERGIPRPLVVYCPDL